MNGSVLPEDVLRDAPSYTPRPHELADLELLLSGAYAPLTGFLGRADLVALRRRGRLADGTAVAGAGHPGGAGRAGAAASTRRTRCTARSVLTDPEGAPVAALDVDRRLADPASGRCGVGGPVRRIGRRRARPVPAAAAHPGGGRARCCRPAGCSG